MSLQCGLRGLLDARFQGRFVRGTACFWGRLHARIHHDLHKLLELWRNTKAKEMKTVSLARTWVSEAVVQRRNTPPSNTKLPAKIIEKTIDTGGAGGIPYVRIDC